VPRNQIRRCGREYLRDRPTPDISFFPIGGGLLTTRVQKAGKARQILLSRMSGVSYLSIVMMKRADLEKICLQLASEHSGLNAVIGGNQVWRRDAILIQCPPKES
jgi:hypothetical protein